MTAICIIPARGGSKRIPRKNIRSFCGKPIIAWPIAAARHSGLFERVVVSTDDSEVAAVAHQWGAEIPFIRSKNLADDFTGTADVILDAVERLEKQKKMYDVVCCAYPTAAFLSEKYLQIGCDLVVNQAAPAAYSVAPFAYPIYRAQKINEQSCLEMIWPEYQNVRSQDLPETYQDAGQFYCIQKGSLLQHRTLFPAGSRPVVIPRLLAHDIDNEEDWMYAELLFNAMYNPQNVPKR